LVIQESIWKWERLILSSAAIATADLFWRAMAPRRMNAWIRLTMRGRLVTKINQALS